MPTESMKHLFWDPFAINMAILAILVSTIVCYLAVVLMRARANTRPSRSLVLLLTFYGGGLLAMIFQLLFYILPNATGYHALSWVSVFGAIAMFGIIRFAFEFQNPRWRTGWVTYAVTALGLFFVILEIWVALERVALLNQGRVEFRAHWVSVPSSIGYIIANLLFWQRYLAAIARDHGYSRFKILPMGLKFLFRSATALSSQAAAARAFVYVTLLPIGHVMLLVLLEFDLITWSIAEPIAEAIIMLSFCGFTMAYLNHAPDQSSFQIKLVGSTLVAVLTILSGISWLIGPVYIDAYQTTHAPKAGISLRFDPTQDQAYRVSQTDQPYDMDLGDKHSDPQRQISLPFAFPFFGTDYQDIFARPGGVIGMQTYPRWRDIAFEQGPQPTIFALAAALQEQPLPGDQPSGVFVKHHSDHTTLSFHRLVSQFEDLGEYSFQVRLFENGRIEFTYLTLPERYAWDLYHPHAAPMMMGLIPGWVDRQVDPLRFSSDLPFTSRPGVGVLENHAMDFRLYLDQIYAPITGFIFVASLLILIIFPRFYQSNLNRPLQAMLGGVDDIMRGDLNTSIAVFHRDEIGYLARAFNQMARSQRDLVTTLEDKVAARTEEAADLAASNARLEERQHLSRELHDAVSQTLFTANLIAQKLPNLIETDRDHAQKDVRALMTLNQDALREIRSLLLELRPENLLNNSCGAQLRRIADNMKSRHAFDIHLHIEQDMHLPDDVQLAFVRVAQEALHNVVKHAQTHHVDVVFDAVEDQAFMSISDDGKGFDPDKVRPGSLGLKSMHERLASIGGILEIHSSAGGGTKITAIWYAKHD
ncbi:MAG: sensor histidine kinase [Pelagimonas sp.]|nr:sensor histidine kinase [Pelagimonas sp.]